MHVPINLNLATPDAESTCLQIIFRVPWVDDAGALHINRGFRVQVPVRLPCLPVPASLPAFLACLPRPIPRYPQAPLP